MQPQGTPQQPQATTEDDQQHTHQLKREPSFGATSSSAGRSTPRFQSAAVIPAYDTPSSPSPSPRVIMGGGAGGGGAAADSRGADSAGHTPRRGGRRRSSYFDTIEATTPLLHHSETYNTVYLTTTAPPPPHTQPQRPPQPPPTRNDRGHQHQHHPHHRNQQQQGPRREQGVGVGVGASVGGEGSRGTSGVSVEGTAVICTSVTPAAGVSDGDAEGGYRRRAEGNAAAVDGQTQDGGGGVEVVVPGADYGPVMRSQSVGILARDPMMGVIAGVDVDRGEGSESAKSNRAVVASPPHERVSGGPFPSDAAAARDPRVQRQYRDEKYYSMWFDRQKQAQQQQRKVQRQQEYEFFNADDEITQKYWSATSFGTEDDSYSCDWDENQSQTSCSCSYGKQESVSSYDPTEDFDDYVAQHSTSHSKSASLLPVVSGDSYTSGEYRTRSRSGSQASFAESIAGLSEVERREAMAESRRGSSSPAATGQFMKSMLGAAILSTPKAFSQSGLWLGVIFIPILTGMVLASLLLLVKSKRAANRNLGGDPYRGPVITFKDMGSSINVVAKWGVLLTVAAMQLCYCTGWVIVMSNTLHGLLPSIYRIVEIMWIMIILIVLSWIRFIKHLVYTSLIGLVIYIFGVIGISLYYAIPNIDAEHYATVTASSYQELPLFFSTVLYCFGGGFNSVISCESTLKDPKKATQMIVTGIPSIGLIIAAYGTLMYIAGFNSCSVALDCLPEGTAVTCVKVLFLIALLCTYPLGLSVAIEIVEDEIFSESTHFTVRCMSRSVFVLGTCVVAAVFSDFSVFSNMVGSALLPIVGFMVPPFLCFRLILLSETGPWNKWHYIGSAFLVFMIAFGVCFQVFTVFGLIMDYYY